MATKSIKTLSAILVALIAVVGALSLTSAAAPQPALVEELALSSNDQGKLPSVATGNGRVYVGWGVPSSTRFAERDEEGGQFAFADPPLGTIGSNPTYFNTAVAVGSDGTVHFAWIQDGSSIRYRNRRAGQAWSGVGVAATDSAFATSMVMSVQGSSNVFIVWRSGEALRFAYSNNAGGSWAVSNVSMGGGASYAGKPSLAVGPSGEVYLLWKSTDGSIKIGQWNGSNFSPSTVVGGGNDFFNPTVSVAPNGQVYAAWRSIGSGVYYAVRQDNGSWGVSNVFRQSGVGGPVKVVVDSLSNVHLAWLSQEGGSWNAWYAMKTPADSFSSPIVASRDGGYHADVDMAVSVKSGYTLAHIAWESFANGLAIRYSRVKTPVGPAIPTGTLSLSPRSGANGYTNQATVNATITNTSASPALTYSLADGTQPGTPLTPFIANPSTVPFTLVNDGLCRVHTVYGTLGNVAGVSATFSASIGFDPSVDAAVLARNPNLSGSQSAPTAGAQPNTAPDTAIPANAGDPGYTPLPSYFLSITAGGNECSGLVSFTRTFVAVPAGVQMPAPKTQAITGGSFSSLDSLAAPGTNALAGAYDFNVTVTDKAGNTRRYPATGNYRIVLDYDAPTASVGGGTTAPTTEEADGLARLDLSTLSVQDTQYVDPANGAQYWGYWVAVKKTSDGAPTTNDWLTRGIVVHGQVGSALRWNMASGLVGSFEPGASYTVYVRFLDGAGNPSPPITSQSVQVDKLQGPMVFLPIVAR